MDIPVCIMQCRDIHIISAGVCTQSATDTRVVSITLQREESLQSEHAKSGLIVGLVGNLIDKLAVDYLTVGINDNDGAGKQSL